MKKVFYVFAILSIAIIIGCGGSKEDKLTDPVIDAKIGVELGHYWNMTCAAFSPDGKSVASSAHDKSIIIWDYTTKHQLKVYRPQVDNDKDKSYKSLSYSSDGKMIIAGVYDLIDIFDAKTCNKTKTIEVKGYSGNIQAISNDDKFIAVDTKNNISIIDLTSGSITKTIEGHTDGFNDIVFSPDNKMIGSASYDSTACIWNTETGEIIKKLEIGNKVTSISFNKTSETVAISVKDIKEIQIWDIKTAKKLNTISDVYSEKIIYINDELLVKLSSKVLLYNDKTGEIIKSIDSYGYELSLSQDGKFATNISGTGVAIIDIEAGKEISEFGKDTRYVSKVRVSPSGRFIITENSHKSSSGGPDILSYAVDTAYKFSAYHTSGSGNNIMDFKGKEDVIFAEISYGELLYHDLKTGNTLSKIEDKVTDPVNITTDGALLIAEDKSLSGAYAIFDSKTGTKTKDLINSTAHHYFSGITPDDKYYAMLTMDFFKVWELPSGNEVKTYEREDMDDVKFIDMTTDGKYIVGRADSREFQICDIMTSEVLFLVKDIEPKYAALNADKNTVAIACDDWTIQVYDIAKNAQIALLKGHLAPVVSVSYSPDGKYLLSSSQDNQTKVWDKATGKELLTIVGLEKIGDYEGHTKDFVVFAPNGRYDGSEAGIKQFLYMEKDSERLPVDAYTDKCYTPNLIGRTLGQNFIASKTEQ